MKGIWKIEMESYKHLMSAWWYWRLIVARVLTFLTRHFRNFKTVVDLKSDLSPPDYNLWRPGAVQTR